MYNKLTKSELRIIEQTRRQDQETLDTENHDVGAQRGTLAIVKSIVIWILVFLCLILFGYFMLWIGYRFAS